MTVKIVEVDKEKGRHWLESSLAGGQAVAAAVLASEPFDGGRFQTFVPAGVPAGKIEFPETGIFPVSAGRPGLARFLDELTSDGAACVVVEDDLLERTDLPSPARRTVPAAFLGKAVLHWCDLEPKAGRAAAGVVQESSSGYPLNAFVVTKSAAGLGMINGNEVPSDLPDRIAKSLLAVIASAFDGQSFAVWSKTDSRTSRK